MLSTRRNSRTYCQLSVRVGGLIKIDNTWIRGRGQGAVANIDHITTPGVYAIGELVPSINDFGIMEVISPGQPNTYTVQILTTVH